MAYLFFFPSPCRHQSTGAVIARCGQPEVSWWGWRNADDEHLVQSIAKACAVDSSGRKHLTNGGYTNGSDLPDTDFGTRVFTDEMRCCYPHSHTHIPHSGPAISRTCASLPVRARL